MEKMKVKELIKVLQNFNEDDEVRFLTFGPNAGFADIELFVQDVSKDFSKTITILLN